MSGPGRIITIINSIPQPWRLLIVELVDERDKAKADLQNPAVLAALPEVQALIAEAVAREREACVAECQHRASQHENNGHYLLMREVELCAAAIRKRGEGMK